MVWLGSARRKLREDHLEIIRKLAAEPGGWRKIVFLCCQRELVLTKTFPVAVNTTAGSARLGLPQLGSARLGLACVRSVRLGSVCISAARPRLPQISLRTPTACCSKPRCFEVPCLVVPNGLGGNREAKTIWLMCSSLYGAIPISKGGVSRVATCLVCGIVERLR